MEIEIGDLKKSYGTFYAEQQNYDYIFIKDNKYYAFQENKKNMFDVEEKI